MPAQIKVAAIVLNYKRTADTLTCLGSVVTGPGVELRRIVLNYDAESGTADRIRAVHPDVIVHDLQENRGYAGNNNVGVELALLGGADWVFILNEDTVLDGRCLDTLLDVGRADPGIGMLGPMVYHHQAPNVIQSAGGRLTKHWDVSHIGANEADAGQHREARDVDWISGCALLVRRAAIENAGLLDERFFCYWEETEWCIRIRQAGWRIVHVPNAKLWHKGAVPNRKPSPAYNYFDTRNRLLMLSKHSAPIAARLLAWAQIGKALVYWSVSPRLRRSMGPNRDAVWHGVIDFALRRWGNRVH